MGLAVDGDLALLHGLQQRGLGLGRGAVDLVRQQDLREDRSRPELELVELLIERPHAGDVGGQQVRRELDAPEGGVQGAGQRLGQHGLADAGHVFDQEVALAEQGDEAEADLLLFVPDGAAHVFDHGIGHAADGIEGDPVGLAAHPPAPPITRRLYGRPTGASHFRTGTG